MEGCYELHWQDREFGERSLQLYGRTTSGQLALVDKLDLGPFDGASDAAQWLTRALYREHVLPAR